MENIRFKIYGERNSGTNFLKKLLDTNFGRAFDQKIEGNIKYYWRHANPSSSIRKLNPNIIEVFIIRNLNNWLVSMFKNPYHIKRFKKFKDFLEKPQMCTEKQYIDSETHKIINVDDNNKTIFEIRYYKLTKIFQHLEKYPNIVIINLENLQNKETCIFFLDKLKEKFNLKPKVKTYEVEFPHTKQKDKSIKNRDYDVDVNKFLHIIQPNMNPFFEDKINKVFILKTNKVFDFTNKN